MGKRLVYKRRAENKCNRKEFHREYGYRTKYLKNQDRLGYRKERTN